MIFLSYRRDDTSDMVGRLYDQLVRSFPGQVFKDVDSIPPGVHYPTYLVKCLSKSRVFVPVIGPTWLGTNTDGTRRIDHPEDFVRIEVEAALKHGIPVIPVIVGDITGPRGDQLPDSLAVLSQLQTLRLRSDPDFGHDVDRLVRSLRRYIRPRRRFRRLVLIVASLILAIVLVITGLELLRSYRELRLTRFLNPQPSVWSVLRSNLSSWIGTPSDDAFMRAAGERKSVPGLDSGAVVLGVPFNTAWIFMGYYDEDRGLFREGPFGRVAFRANGVRGEILPEIGDVIEITKVRRLIIGRYQTRGAEYELTPPALLSDPLSDNDDTGRTLSKGRLVIVRDVDINGHPRRQASVWCRVAECDSDTPSCNRAKSERKLP